MDTRKFFSITWYDIPGKNFTLICPDGSYQVHHIFLIKNSEVVYNMLQYGEKSELVVDFPKRYVRKCVKAFYKEYEKEYDPIMYDIFAFLGSPKEYLDTSLYKKGVQGSDLFTNAVEEDAYRKVCQNSIVLDKNTKMTQDIYEAAINKYAKIPEELNEDDSGMSTLNEAIHCIKTVIVYRLSSILFTCVTKEDYNRRADECLWYCINSLYTSEGTIAGFGIINNESLLLYGVDGGDILNSSRCNHDYFSKIGMQRCQHPSENGDHVVILFDRKKSQIFGRTLHEI